MCKARPAIEHKQLTISKQREGVSARMCEIKKSIKNFRIQISGFAGRYYQFFPHARPLISEEKKKQAEHLPTRTASLMIFMK